MIIDENKTTEAIDFRNTVSCYNHPHLSHWEGELHKITTSPGLLSEMFLSAAWLRDRTHSRLSFRMPHTNLSAIGTTVGMTTLPWFE